MLWTCVSATLPVMLVGVASFASPVLGALCGIIIAEERFTNNYLPSAQNLVFAFVWGATGGVISALFITPYAVGQIKVVWLVLVVMWIAVAILSGFSLYVFVVQAGSV